MPERFLLQILRSLVTSGILRSTRGVEGGYCLKRPPEQISLLEIIEAVEGKELSESSVSDLTTDQAQATLQKALDNVAANMRRQLEGIKVGNLLNTPAMASPTPTSVLDGH
jgi:Rrf2 family protein